MKLEFVFAVVLLATGCLLFQNGYFQSNANPADEQRAEFASNSQKSSPLATQSIDEPAPINQLAEAPVQRPQPGKSAASLMAEAVENIRNASAFTCDAQIQIQLLGEVSYAAQGKYFQQGSESNQSRLELNIGNGPSAERIIQIFDGRFDYVVRSCGDESKLSLADISKLDDASQLNDHPSAPSQWFTRGGVAGLLENLSEAFQFESPVRGQLGEIPVLIVRGQWKPDALAECLEGQMDEELLSPTIAWDKLPPQIPHAVEICLGDDNFFKLFPYQVSFQKFENSSSGTIRIPFMNVALTEVAHVPSAFPADLFVVDSANLDAMDTTRSYVMRIEELQQIAIARSRSGAKQGSRTAAKPESSSRKPGANSGAR